MNNLYMREVGQHVTDKNIDELLCVGKAKLYIVQKAKELGMSQCLSFLRITKI